MPIVLGDAPRRSKRAEARARYYIREQAFKRGWATNHIQRGGDFLEEQEIVAAFPDIGLGLEKPDFLVTLRLDPIMVIEAKNDVGFVDQALGEAIGYADRINASRRYRVRVAVGAAGTDDTGFVVQVRFLVDDQWLPLRSGGYELTNIPSKREVELAMAAGDATTTVTIPSPAEFIDAAIELSHILRLAKVEAPLRPKVIGAMVLAMYQSDPVLSGGLTAINSLIHDAVRSTRDLSPSKQDNLTEALRLSGAAFSQLEPTLGRVVAILRRLNIRSVMHSGVDFLGQFYEAFLRYGYDNTALGIVFTPRHITRLCADLAGVEADDAVVDIACGTGGFLVSAYDVMAHKAPGTEGLERIKQALYGYETNPTVWALALLNMFFRGDGKSNIEHASSLEPASRERLARQFDRAFLNPPFSQEGEPERLFIDVSMDALRPGGILAVVVKAGIFADDIHEEWRREFSRRHTVLGVISLPEDLFYPTASPTSILLARAHEPQSERSLVYMGRIWNDGFEKLKSRRVERPGSQIPEVLAAFRDVLAGRRVSTPISATVEGHELADGREWSPQNWLPQPPISADEFDRIETDVIQAILQAIAHYPGLADQVLADFGAAWQSYPALPPNTAVALEDIFEVVNGKSRGEKNYLDGPTPYISSGEQSNSITRLISPIMGEEFGAGGVTVTAFGQASVQPWVFAARGNGGSAVRVLIPKYRMTARHLIWLAAQINVQQWRFFYARMAIKWRLKKVRVVTPPHNLPDLPETLRSRAERVQQALREASQIPAAHAASL